MAAPNEAARQAVVWGFTVLAAGALLLAALSVFLGFQPYTLVKYSAVPNVVCPLDPVDVSYARIVQRPFLGSVTDFVTLSRWVKEGGGRLDVERDQQGFAGNYGPGSGISKFKRFAPNESGMWRVEASITTNGYQLLKPQAQTIGHLETSPITTDPIRVLEPTDPRCTTA